MTGNSLHSPFRRMPENSPMAPPRTARPPAAPADGRLHSIADAERESGLPRATIRIWERRYGFPMPHRDERGERAYTDEQVDQLRLMRRLVEQGHRPAQLASSGGEALRKLAQDEAAGQLARRARRPSPFIELLRTHDEAALKALLEDRLSAVGLAAFAGSEVVSMNEAVGSAWAAGELEVFEEHLYSDCIEDVLRPAIARAQEDVRPEAPRVLLTTLPQEAHALGLLMAQAVFAAQGCPTISLGVQLPPQQIVAAARAYAAELVGLSFSSAMGASPILRGLEELRGMMPPPVRIWAGGRAPVLGKRSIAGVRVVTDVRAIPDHLAEDFALAPR
jgi:DNA-binding transcriptional MerR regulator/methylmalonyl-CoA mutase cobalamin-binding subunit